MEMWIGIGILWSAWVGGCFIRHLVLMITD